MKGWYCIYECSKNRWLMKNEWWANDRDLLSVRIPIEYKLSSYRGGDGEMEYQLHHNNYRDVALMSADYKINKFQLVKFETLQEAERYLFDAGFSTNDGQFYTIRKIYF